MDQPRGAFVGRVEMLRSLRSWLTGEVRAAALPSIGSISGSAGIGKTFLLDHALRETDTRARRYVTLRVAATSVLPTLAGVVMDLTANVRTPTQKKVEFARVGECRGALEWMDSRAREEVEREVAEDSGLPKSVAEIYALARGLVQFVPLPQAQLAARIAGMVEPKHVEKVVRLIQKAAAYQTEKAPRLSGRGDVKLRNHLRTELGETLARALVDDLERELVGGFPFRRDVGERGRLLLIIDDYERLADVAGEFLLRHLVPQLAAAPFESLVLQLGRDRLVDTDPGWRQHCQQHLLGDLVLSELSSEEAIQYVQSRGITDPEKVNRIVRDTAGYPYLLESEVDDEIHGQSSALSRELFFERTTQWMSPQQKTWAIRLAFLAEISLERIPRVLPNENAEAVLAWFKRESSLRAPTADRWSMRPMIRSKLQEYVRNDSPAKFAELEKIAAGD